LTCRPRSTDDGEGGAPRVATPDDRLDVPSTTMTRTFPLSIFLVLSLSGACAANNYRHTIAEYGAISDALIAVQRAELQEFASHAYDDARHQRYKAVIDRIVSQRDQLNDALSRWDPGKPPPPVIAQAVEDLHGIMNDAATLTPPPGFLLSSIEQAIGLLTINPA
jgi:hypothetical protein